MKKRLSEIPAGQSAIIQEFEKNDIFLPPYDPDNVDKRRAKVGLKPISEYVKGWGIIWNVVEYKKQLPEIEAKYRNGKY